MAMAHWKEPVLSVLVLAGLLGVCYLADKRHQADGDFSIPPGGIYTREENLIGSNLMPDNQGKEYRDVPPVRIDKPDFITLDLLSSLSGGHYLNFSWQERTDIKYRISASPNAPLGKYSVSIEFPSGYTHTITFSVRE
jgi:hypothetical protein